MKFRPSQYALKPHRDEADVAITLSVRESGSLGGALMVSTMPGGNFDYRSDKPNTVETRREKVKICNQLHGDVIKLHGSMREHCVTPVSKAPRYSLVLFCNE